MRLVPRPSIAQAVQSLRTHAIVARLERDDDAIRERDKKRMRMALWAIANCIEEIPGWRFKRGGALHPEQERLLDGVARWKAPLERRKRSLTSSRAATSLRNGDYVDQTTMSPFET